MKHIQIIIFLLFYLSIFKIVSAQQLDSALTQEILSIDTVEIRPSLPLVVVKFIDYKDNDFDTYDFLYTRIEFSTVNDTIPFQIVRDTANGIYDYEFNDINFDGYKDLQIDEPMTPSGVNTPCSFWLFNPATEKFEASEKFSNLCNVYINESDSSFTSEWNWGGRNHSESEKYKVSNGYPVLIEEGIYDWGNYSRKELINNQMIETHKETLEAKEDANGEVYALSIEEELILGKLRPVEIVKKMPVDQPPAEINYETYQESFDGRFIIISKETISYQLNEQNKIVKRSVFEEVKNNKLIVTKETNEIVE